MLTLATAALLAGSWGLGGSPVSAASPSPRATPSASGPRSSPGIDRVRYCQDFVNHLSADLGINKEKLQAAMAKAGHETIDDAVAKGDLTKERASAMKARISSQSLCSASPDSHDGTSGGGV
jgi:ribosomal protein S20